MLRTLEYTISEQLLEEIKAIEKDRDRLYEKLNNATSLFDYISPFLLSSAGHELVRKVSLSKPGKILDIGFGRGETSLYLANQNHEVHAIEPSMLNCEILENACKKYGKNVQVHQGTIEAFEHVTENEFDLCLFNSSLHHCDDPVKALRICKEKLKVGGRIIAINEPILKFYRSKKWFFKQLEVDPVSLGHYGGNEHIYYYREYEALFKKAGFSTVKGTLHVGVSEPRQVLLEDLQRKVGTEFVYSERKLCLKFLILIAMKSFWLQPVDWISKKLSLFPYGFEAS